MHRKGVTLSIDSPVVMLRLNSGSGERPLPGAAPNARAMRIEQLVQKADFRGAICESARVYGPQLNRFFARWAALDADDAVQDTLLKAYDSLRRGMFDGRGSFSAWLFRIASNLRKERFRKLKRREALVAENPGVIQGQSMGSGAHDPERTLEATRAMARLNAVIANWPAADQSLLALRFSAGLSWQDVGDVLGIKPETAKVRGMRLRRKLAEELSE